MTSYHLHNKSNQVVSKNVSKSNSRPILIKQYSSKSNNFFINIKTPIKKQKNHFIFGDEIQSIVNQVHQFYDMQIQSAKFAANNQLSYGKLIETLKLPLGNQILLQNDSLLVKEVFPRMSKLKQFQKLKDVKYRSIIWLQIKWKNSYKIQKLKTAYLHHYQPQLLQRYRYVRQIFSKKWKNHVKNKGKSQQDQISDHKNQQKLQIQKNQTITNAHTNYIYSFSKNDQQNYNQSQKEELQSKNIKKMNQFNMNETNKLNQKQNNNKVENNIKDFKRNISQRLDYLQQQTQVSRKMIKTQQMNDKLITNDCLWPNQSIKQQNTCKYLAPNQNINKLTDKIISSNTNNQQMRISQISHQNNNNNQYKSLIDNKVFKQRQKQERTQVNNQGKNNELNMLNNKLVREHANEMRLNEIQRYNKYMMQKRQEVLIRQNPIQNQIKRQNIIQQPKQTKPIVNNYKQLINKNKNQKKPIQIICLDDD